MAMVHSKFANAMIGSSLQNSTEITTGSTDHVFLQIGDRQFLTARKTLAHAEGFFGRLLAERWATSKDNIKLHTTPHGIHCEYHFIDRDGDVFSHILGYLRSGMFPVFYDVENGHDHLLYAKLLKEAMYYCMDSLVLWVKEKKYEKAVRVRWVMTHEGPATQFDTKSTETIQLKPTSTTLQRYICPRGLHYGNRSGCGRQCRNAQGDEPIRYREELVHETVCYRREVIFDHDVMNANT